ncbi:MAG: DUF2066 domain-containing protein [Parvularculaceae bacterium]|nr:DUF2066 domain-containing protein [Parvularculaceae bacterium]
MKILGLIAAALVAFIAHAGSARAAGEDVFIVARVPVQASGDSATDAKENAQASGRRRAMDLLLRRLTTEPDWKYLPVLAAGRAASSVDDGAGKTPLTISPAALEGLESGFEVYNEKASSTSYRAYITYRFKPDAVRRLLKQSKIPYSEAQTRVALVLPVLQTASGLYLWESNNPWMAAWKARPYTHELTPMQAPLGDLEDSSAITPRQALDLNPAALATIAARYNVSQVIVAHGRLARNGPDNQLTVRLLNAYRETGKAGAGDILGHDAEIESDGSQSQTFIYAIEDDDFATKVGEVLAQTALSEPVGNFPALAERSIDAAITRYSSGWKAKTLIDHSKEAVLPVSAFFDRLEDWSKIRAALIATPLVGAVQVSALSRRGAEMNVRVFGDPAKVQVAMENQGIVFWSETGERWFLATPSVASKYRGRRFLRDRRGLFGAEGEAIGNDNGPVPASDTVIDDPFAGEPLKGDQ